MVKSYQLSKDIYENKANKKKLRQHRGYLAETLKNLRVEKKLAGDLSADFQAFLTTDLSYLLTAHLEIISKDRGKSRWVDDISWSTIFLSKEGILWGLGTLWIGDRDDTKSAMVPEPLKIQVCVNHNNIDYLFHLSFNSEERYICSSRRIANSPTQLWESREEAVFGTTRLIQFAERNDENNVNRLLSEGANANEVDRNGLSALLIASFFGFTGVVRNLLEGGADPSFKLKENANCLMVATQFGYLDIVRSLLNCRSQSVIDMAMVEAALSFALYAEQNLMRKTKRPYDEIVKILQKEVIAK